MSVEVAPNAGDYLIADAYRDQLALNVINRDNLADLVARVRHQAEEAMRERCAKVAALEGGILALAQGHEDAEGQEDRWYDGGRYAAKKIAAAIRGMEVE